MSDTALFAGEAMPTLEAEASKAGLASELINITLRNLTFSSGGKLEPVVKKLPQSLTVSKLQLVVKQVCVLCCCNPFPLPPSKAITQPDATNPCCFSFEFTEIFLCSCRNARVCATHPQLFGLDPHLQQLSLRLYKDAVPVLLDDPQASIGYFGAIDGSEIFINEAKG